LMIVSTIGTCLPALTKNPLIALIVSRIMIATSFVTIVGIAFADSLGDALKAVLWLVFFWLSLG
jgi:hypothetical protein